MVSSTLLLCLHQMHALEERRYIRGDFGDRMRHVSENQLHASQIEGWCRGDRGLTLIPQAEPSAEDRAIGELVAERIRDGSTIQIGIGRDADASGLG